MFGIKKAGNLVFACSESKTFLNSSFKTEEILPLQAKTKFPAYFMPNMPQSYPLEMFRHVLLSGD